MRKVLFRGKLRYGEGWIYGSYIKIGSLDSICEGSKLFKAIIPETVGQFTGLTDRNGTKIFDGDIVETPKYGVGKGDRNFSGKDKFQVGYAEGTYFIENGTRRFCLRLDKDIKVIGNIHDNPELIGGDENART